MPDRAPTALQNWAGNIRFSPSRFEAPATLDEARSAVAAAPRLRVLGRATRSTRSPPPTRP